MNNATDKFPLNLPVIKKKNNLTKTICLQNSQWGSAFIPFRRILSPCQRPFFNTRGALLAGRNEELENITTKYHNKISQQNITTSQHHNITTSQQVVASGNTFVRLQMFIICLSYFVHSKNITF
jgi:hypothetical protein